MTTPEVDEDWEDWDGVSPFWHHCLAGSIAGLAEHTLVYPLDTVRTHIQVCANCKYSPEAAGFKTYSTNGAGSSSVLNQASHQVTLVRGRSLSAKAAATAAQQHQQQLPTGVWQTMRYLMSEPVVLQAGQGEMAGATGVTSNIAPKVEGIMRLWRGVQTMMIGCIPAHALYFSSYEMVKAFWQQQSPTSEIVWYGSMMAGATATLGHDSIMAPLDTVKQRLQIGHYQGSMATALKQMMHKEGPIALYRSFPITLLANVPYGMIMVSTNEGLKQIWTRSPDGQSEQSLDLSTTLLASSAAGFVASAATTPLDRIKTLLQTQQMAPACLRTTTLPPANCNRPPQPLVVQNAFQALQHILRQEGTIGLFRGLVPRVMSHTPAVAISWTSYETAKSVLWKVTSS